MPPIGYKARVFPRQWISCRGRLLCRISMLTNGTWQTPAPFTVIRRNALSISECTETSVLTPAITILTFLGLRNEGKSLHRSRGAAVLWPLILADDLTVSLNQRGWSRRPRSEGVAAC